MSDKLKKIEFKRMLKRYESALEDLEYLQEMASEINSDFNSALAAKKRQDLFESKKVEDLAEEAEEVDEKESAARDPLFKKLFRKIVVQCHPDRMDPDLSIKQQAERLEFYELANKANEEDNMALLITVAIKLEIELSEEYMQHVEKIKEEYKKIEESIKSIQGSIAWQWYHAEEDSKDKMLNQYITHLENILMGPKKLKKKILGLGHPRTGTGYTHTILNSWGLKVGHEKMEKDGIVAWQLVDPIGPWPFMKAIKEGDAYAYDFIIYNVRDPRTSIPSIVFSENKDASSSKFRSERFGVNLNNNNRIANAINSILKFDNLILKRNPDFVYRIEDQSEELFKFLESNDIGVTWSESKINKKYNARKHAGWDKLEEDLKTLRPSLKIKINDFCNRHGYDPLF